MISIKEYTDPSGNEVDVDSLLNEIGALSGDSVDTSLCLEPYEWEFIYDCIRDALQEG